MPGWAAGDAIRPGATGRPVPGYQAIVVDEAMRPLPPGASKHKDVRYLDIREDDRLDDARLARWVRQASRLPGWGKA